jgi:hypothetical protein
MGSAGSGSINTASILREARARVAAKKSGVSQSRAEAPPPIDDLAIGRVNDFEQKLEEDGILTTVIYDAFGRFRRAILPKGQLVDIYM